MVQTFSRYDAADYLESDEDIRAYLEAAVEDGEPSTLTAALGAVARAHNMSQLARDSGMTREGLYKALSPGGNPSFATVAKVAAALSLALTLHPVPRLKGATSAKRTTTTKKPQQNSSQARASAPIAPESPSTRRTSRVRSQPLV